MEATRPVCIPPPVGFHVMKNLCNMAGEVQSVIHPCSVRLHIDICTCSSAVCNFCAQPKIDSNTHTKTVDAEKKSI